MGKSKKRKGAKKYKSNGLEHHVTESEKKFGKIQLTLMAVLVASALGFILFKMN